MFFIEAIEKFAKPSLVHISFTSPLSLSFLRYLEVRPFHYAITSQLSSAFLFFMSKGVDYPRFGVAVLKYPGGVYYPPPPSSLNEL